MDQRFSAAVRYLESYIHELAEPPPPAERLRAWQQRLPAMERLLARLGNPHQQFKAVHVGGTSGKGSTAAFIASMLQAAGYRTGLHTSPYLQLPTEKMQVDGRDASPGEFADLVEWARPLLEAAQRASSVLLGYVDVATALAFAYFAQQRVDYAVIEVSLGGRYDSTNVLHPDVSVITNVGLDHTATLGATIEDIAHHKAGIIKPYTPAVTGIQEGPALAVLAREAAAQQAPIRTLGRDFHYRIQHCDITGAHFDFFSSGGTYRDLEIRLLGRHQTANATLALAAIEALQKRGAIVSEAAVRAGLHTSRFPGRLEVVQQAPLVVLDGAHNPPKAATLREALQTLFPQRPLILVLGIGASKDAAEIVETLAPRAATVVCTEANVTGKPALPAHEIARLVHDVGVPARIEPQSLSAVAAAMDLAGPEGMVCVTGSLYVVGAARERWFPSEEQLARQDSTATAKAN